MMVFDDPLHNCQADPSALSNLFFCRWEPLEYLGNLIKILFLNANAVIADKEYLLAVLFFDPYINARGWVL